MTSLAFDADAAEGNEDRSGSNKLSSVDKAVSVLEAFAGPGSTRSLQDISRRADLPKSTAHRLLSRLTDHGLVVRVGGNYALGTRLFELGNLVPACRPRQLRDVAMPYLCELRKQIDATVHLGVLQDGEVLYLERLPGSGSASVPSTVGGKQPAHCTSLGKALLAHADEVTTERFLRAGLTRYTPQTITSPEVLRARLAEIRERGWAADVEERHPNVRCLAVPILVGPGRATAVAALSISSPGGPHMDRLRQMWQAASAIALRLGG